MYHTQPIDTDILAALAQADLPCPLVQWLAKLKTLQGVPFNYLVSDDRFLPAESIRFFELDATWLNALLDGALSIGRHYTPSPNASLAVVPELAQQRNLHVSVAQEAPRLRKRQLKLDDGDCAARGTAATWATVTSGFLLRSKAVSAWKSMDVAAYPKGSSPYDYETIEDMKANQVQALDILRLERLSADVLLGIFNGPVYELVLHQPPEAIHFGFSKVDGSTVTKELRVPDRDWDDSDTKYHKEPDRQLEGVFVSAENRVLDMVALSTSLATQLNGFKKAPGYYEADPDSNHKDHLVSSDFALEMVQGVGLVSFINGKK